MSAAPTLIKAEYETDNTEHAIRVLKSLRDRQAQVKNGVELSHCIHCIAEIDDIYKMTEDLDIVSRIGLEGCRFVIQFLQTLDYKSPRMDKIIDERSGVVNLNELFGHVYLFHNFESFYNAFIKEFDFSEHEQLARIALSSDPKWIKKDADGYYYTASENGRNKSKIILADIPLFFDNYLFRDESFKEQATDFIINKLGYRYAFKKMENGNIIAVINPFYAVIDNLRG